MTGGSPRESLGAILKVERIRSGSFTARLEEFWGATQGGDAAARAALAAAESCEGRTLHSVHTLFYAPLPPQRLLDLEVTSLNEDDLRSTRHVAIRLEGRTLASVTLTFGPPGEGLTYQGSVLDDGLPKPEDLPGTAKLAEAEGWGAFAKGPIEFRRVGRAWPWPPAGPAETSVHREWILPRERLPRDTRVEMAAVVFVSGFHPHWMASDRMGNAFRADRFSLREHTLWVHRPARWDGWWMLKAITEVGHAGRMFARRELSTREGTLVASCAQEGYYAPADRS
jgi:acyl-CoA thioesterase-2